MDNNNDIGKKIIQQAMRAFNSQERVNAETIWSELSEFILNNQSGLFQTSTLSATASEASSKGQKKTQRVYTAVPARCSQELASAMHYALTNPAFKWSRFTYDDESLNGEEDAVIWLQDVNQRFHSRLNASNFTAEINKAYRMLTALGSMALFVDGKGVDNDGIFKGFRFEAWHLSQLSWSENYEGKVDKIFRKFSMTARQAYERWGMNVPADIYKAYEKDPEKEFDFIHCITPRNPKEVRLSADGLAPPSKRPYASYIVSKLDHKLLEEDGYYEFPVLVVRMELCPGEIYGRGPAHLALPEIRTLNKYKDLMLVNFSRSVLPPMLAQHRDLEGALDLRPGRINYVNDINAVKTIENNTRFDVVQFGLEQMIKEIESIFMLDKLTLPPRTETGEMTALEVSHRIEEMQQVMAPTLSRLHVELLDPLVQRCFSLMRRGNDLAPMPESLLNRRANFKIQYLNKLSRSQRMEDVGSIQAWVQDLAMLAQIKPEVIDNINQDAIARHTADIRGVPGIAIVPDEQVAELREQRAQQAQAQQMMQTGVSVADMASKMGGMNGGQ